MKKSYRFTFDTNTQQDVINIIESIPKTLRSQYLVEIIRYAHSKLLECPPVNVSSERVEKKEQVNKVDLSKIFGNF